MENFLKQSSLKPPCMQSSTSAQEFPKKNPVRQAMKILIEDNNSEIEKEQSSAHSKEKMFYEIQSRMCVMAEQCQKLREENRELTTKLKEAQDLNGTMSEKNESLSVCQKFFEEQIQSKDFLIDSYKKKIMKLKQQIKGNHPSENGEVIESEIVYELKIKYKIQKNNITFMQQKNSALQNELLKLKESYQVVRENNEKLKEIIANLETEISDLENKNNQLKFKEESARNEMKLIIQSSNQKELMLKKKNIEIKQLQEIVERKRLKLRSMNNEQSRKEEKIKQELEDNKRNAQEYQNELLNAISELKNQYSHTTNIKDTSILNDEYCENAEAVKQENEKLTSELESIKKDSAIINQKYAMLKQKHSLAKNELEKMLVKNKNAVPTEVLVYVHREVSLVYKQIMDQLAVNNKRKTSIKASGKIEYSLQSLLELMAEKIEQKNSQHK